MDRKNGGLSSKCAVLIPVSKSSDVFKKVVAPLHNAYLHGESKHSFRYTSAFLFNNSKLQERYDVFRAKGREAGYSEEELKEGYGFLLFDDINKATELGETGVLTGNSTCKTLGDPSKGVYISKYSDCLAPDHWYCGKSGFIVIIRLTKGRSNKVQENYTQNCIAPTVGFDCHESKELPMVSANTSSFLAYERTQYYLYELLPGECSKTTLSPSQVCPFAIVQFSYDDTNTKATTSSCQEESELDGNVLNNMWSGQLHISSQIYHVRLKSRSRALIPVKLPPVIKVDQAVSMATVRRFAPKAVFETHFSGEVSLDGICCSVYEFVPIEVEDPSLSLLIRELKDKDLGLTVCLNESGFLILLHSSNFVTCAGNESSVTEALQAMFLFPGSRAIQKGRQNMENKGELEESQISSDILHILPALNYAEIEVHKSSIGQSEDIGGQFVQQIKNYAALIHSGLAATPSKDVSPLSQDYDESLTSLCSSPKWTNQVWQWLRSYLSHPVSFQLPVYSVTELLAAGNKQQKEVLDEDEDHVCLSPLEQAPGTVCSIGPEELLSESTASDVSSSLLKDGANKDSETNSILNCPLSPNPTAELVVSITSAEGTTTVMDKCLSGSNAMVATKHPGRQLSNTLMATNTVDKKPSANTTARKTLPRGRPKGKRKCFKRSSSPADEPLTSTSEKQDEVTQPSQCTSISEPPKTKWTILEMSDISKCNGGKLTYKYKKVPRRSLQLQENSIKQNKPRRMENVTSTGLDACSLTRKTDRWDLRPIITGCGRTLVPHGSLNRVLQKKEQSTDREKCFKEMIEEACQLEKMDQDPVAGQLAMNTTNNVNAGDKCHNTEVVGSPRSETSSSPQHNSQYQDSPTRTPEFGDQSIAEADTSDDVPSGTADISSHLNDMNTSELLICKLKRLFSGRKRKNTRLVLGDSVLPVDAQLSTEPSLKKCKSVDGEMLKMDSNTDCQDSTERNKDVLSFAQALGLMPKEVPDNIQETQNTDTLEKRLPLSLEGQFITPVVKSAQFIQTKPIQEKLQVKRKKQWENDFHTPISSTTESPENKVCAKSNSFEKNWKELFSSTGQSTALSLLADLALGDGNNQAPPQLDPLPMTKLDPRSDVDNRLNDGTKPDNQSVLPSMLKQPADSPVLPSNSPSPEGLVGSKDVIDLIATEHAYSSPATSQVPKTSSPAGMPQEEEHKDKGCNMDAIPSRRFRRSRIFVEKDGFLKVTRKWKGNYDFDLDSKFTNHPVEKTVCRGLHGSWNFAVKDNGEEARLIIHMWIGLFYSRSTQRFIHSSPLDFEDCLDMSDGMALPPSEHETAAVSIGNSDPQDLEPIQKDGLVLNQGSEVLDLSIKKQDVNDSSDISVSCHETNVKEASEAFIREAGIQDEGPAQCQAKHQALQVYRPRPSEFDDDNDGTYDGIAKSTSERADASPQSATNLEHSAVNSLSEDKTCDSSCKVIANIIIQPQLVVETTGSIDPEGSNIETSEMRERNENVQNTEVAVEPPIEMDASSEIMKDIDEDPNSPCTYLVGEENDGNESKCEDEHKTAAPSVYLPDNETQSADVTLPHGSNEKGNEDEDCQSADLSDEGHFTKEEDNSLKPKSVSDGHGTIKGGDPGVSCIALDKTLPEEHDNNESVDEAKIEIIGEQEKSNDSTPLQDGIAGESQAEVLPDVSVVSCDHQEQDEELLENEVKTTQGDGPGVYCQASLVGQPYEGDGKKDASSDEMLQTQCTNVNATMGGGGGGGGDDDTISEEHLNIALDKTLPEEHDNNDSMDEADLEIVSDQNESDNDSTPLQDDIVGESQAEVLPDVSVVSYDHQEQGDELIENEVKTAYILTPKTASHHQAQSSQDGVSKLLQDPSEMPLVGKDDSKQEVEAGPQVLPLQDNPVEVVHEPKEMAMNMDVYRMSLENSEKVSVAEDLLLVFEDWDSKHKLGSEDSDVDERCPTPTKGDGPGVYCQASLVGQPYEGDGKKDASSDEILQTQCANVNASMGGGGDDDDTISEENLNIALDKTLPEEHDNNDSMDEADLEIVSDQNESDNDSTPLQDDIVGESQAKVLPVSVVSCDHQEQDDELIENEVETAYILALKAASHHQAHSPQDGVSKLILDPSKMPFVGKDDSKQEVEAGPQVLLFQENVLEIGNEPKEMAMNINVCHMSLENCEKVQIADNVLSVFEDGNYEHKLGSEASELNERCPTPTVDENPYEYIPSLEQSTSNQLCKSSPEKEHRTNSTLTHQWQKEVHDEPELKMDGDQDPGRDLCEENQTPRSRLHETTDLPPSLNQSPILCRNSMDMDNLNDKTSHVDVGMPSAKQSPVKRKMFSEEGCSLPVPCPLKKMSNDHEICEAPVQSRLEDDSHSCSLCPVVVIKPSRTDSQADNIYQVTEMDNLAISNTSDDNQTKILVIPTTRTDIQLDNQTDVSNLTSNDDRHEIEYQLEKRGTLKPSRTVQSIVSTQSDEGEHLSSSSFHDPMQDCPVEKKCGQSSSIHSDDHKGVTDEILMIGSSTSSFKYTNYRFTKTVSNSVEQLTETCIDSDLTQFSMDQEFLIFSEELKRLLNGSKRGPGKNPNHRSMHSYPSSYGSQSVLDLSIDNAAPESGTEETTGENISYSHELSSRGNGAEANVALSDIEAECARSYHTMMDNVCAGKSHLTETDGGLRDRTGSSRQMRSEMFCSLNRGLNLVVRQSSKTKFKFYILMTSDDAFFEETKARLEADGHTEVKPSHFFLNEKGSSSSLLLIILRNQDIAEHIIKVPHLLDLKKSANVLFAGIDQPDDIGNLTHQDLFKKGGFIMLEGTALEALSFCNMKELLDFLQELSKNGKWKWIVHYRDSRRLKENARFSAEEAEKKHLMKCCQETGIVEVLPYHDCDHLSREHPSYLSCLLQLQVHNVTARFPVFVTDKTDTTEDSTFGRHGILTMNINSLLTVIESEKCSLRTHI